MQNYRVRVFIEFKVTVPPKYTPSDEQLSQILVGLRWRFMEYGFATQSCIRSRTDLEQTPESPIDLIVPVLGLGEICTLEGLHLLEYFRIHAMLEYWNYSKVSN